MRYHCWGVSMASMVRRLEYVGSLSWNSLGDCRQRHDEEARFVEQETGVQEKLRLSRSLISNLL